MKEWNTTTCVERINAEMNDDEFSAIVSDLLGPEKGMIKGPALVSAKYDELVKVLPFGVAKAVIAARDRLLRQGSFVVGFLYSLADN